MKSRTTLALPSKMEELCMAGCPLSTAPLRGRVCHSPSVGFPWPSACLSHLLRKAGMSGGGEREGVQAESRGSAEPLLLTPRVRLGLRPGVGGAILSLA